MSSMARNSVVQLKITEYTTFSKFGPFENYILPSLVQHLKSHSLTHFYILPIHVNNIFHVSSWIWGVIVLLIPVLELSRSYRKTIFLSFFFSLKFFLLIWESESEHERKRSKSHFGKYLDQGWGWGWGEGIFCHLLANWLGFCVSGGGCLCPYSLASQHG